MYPSCCGYFGLMVSVPWIIDSYGTAVRGCTPVNEERGSKTLGVVYAAGRESHANAHQRSAGTQPVSRACTPK